MLRVRPVLEGVDVGLTLRLTPRGRLQIVDSDEAWPISEELSGRIGEAFSRGEGAGLLDEVSGFCETLDHWKISDLSHDLPEWKETPRNRDIPVERILHALDKTENEIVEAAEEALEQAFFEEVFSDP